MSKPIIKASQRTVRVIVHGATGRLGTNQHLVRSLLAIRDDGGVALPGGGRIAPEPVLAGRDAAKLEALARRYGLSHWITDLHAALGDSKNEILFDAATTGQRPALIRRALEAGKHVYCEKPLALTLEEATGLHRLAKHLNLANGVVQDKLFLPGLVKLKRVMDSGFLGRVLHVRLDFGWWIFDGKDQPCQRSSWNYRRAEGGGLILDMYPHWRYIVDRLFGRIVAVSCRHQTHVDRRWDEAGVPYDVDVEDAAYATFELETGVLVEVTSSWCTRVRRDEVLVLQVDGTAGSAVAGLHHCYLQPAAATPKPVFDPDSDRGENHWAQWIAVPDTAAPKSSFRAGWELYLSCFARGVPFPYSFLEGAKGLQLVDAAYRSHKERRWIELPKLDADE